MKTIFLGLSLVLCGVVGCHKQPVPPPCQLPSTMDFRALEFTSDGKWLVGTTHEGHQVVHLLDTSTCQLVGKGTLNAVPSRRRVDNGHATAPVAWFYNYQFSPQNTWVVGYGEGAQVWRVADLRGTNPPVGQVVYVTMPGQGDYAAAHQVQAAAFSPDEQWLAYTNTEGYAVLYHLASQRSFTLPVGQASVPQGMSSPANSYREQQDTQFVAFDPTGQFVHVLIGGRLSVVRVTDRSVLKANLLPTIDTPIAIAYSASAQKLALRYAEMLRVVSLDVEHVGAMETLVADRSPSGILVFSPSGTKLAAVEGLFGGGNRGIYLWAFAQGHWVEKHTTLQNESGSFRRLVFVDEETLWSAPYQSQSLREYHIPSKTWKMRWQDPSQNLGAVDAVRRRVGLSTHVPDGTFAHCADTSSCHSQVLTLPRE